MLAYGLCEVLGVPHPKYLLPLLTPRDLAGWNAYFRLKNEGVRGEAPRQYVDSDQASQAMRAWGKAIDAQQARGRK